MGKNVIIFGADMSSLAHIANKNKGILILGAGSTQGLDDTTLEQKLNILLVLPNQEKDLYQVYIIMQATVPYLLMLQKYINSMKMTLKMNIIDCVLVTFPKILQLIIYKNRIKTKCIILFC